MYLKRSLQHGVILHEKHVIENLSVLETINCNKYNIYRWCLEQKMLNQRMIMRRCPRKIKKTRVRWKLEEDFSKISKMWPMITLSGIGRNPIIRWLFLYALDEEEAVCKNKNKDEDESDEREVGWMKLAASALSARAEAVGCYGDQCCKTRRSRAKEKEKKRKERKERKRRKRERGRGGITQAPVLCISKRVSQRARWKLSDGCMWITWRRAQTNSDAMRLTISRS